MDALCGAMQCLLESSTATLPRQHSRLVSPECGSSSSRRLLSEAAMTALNGRGRHAAKTAARRDLLTRARAMASPTGRCCSVGANA